MPIDENIKTLTAQLKDLEKAEAADVAATEKALNAVAKVASVKSTPLFSDLKVSWMQDFELVEVGFAGDLTEDELRRSIQGMPSACLMELKRRSPQATGSSRLSIQSDFRRRQEERDKKSAALREQLHRLKSGSVG